MGFPHHSGALQVIAHFYFVELSLLILGRVLVRRTDLKWVGPLGSGSRGLSHNENSRGAAPVRPPLLIYLGASACTPLLRVRRLPKAKKPQRVLSHLPCWALYFPSAHNSANRFCGKE
jgi:hypothetical protein